MVQLLDNITASYGRYNLMSAYTLSFQITPDILTLVTDISEQLGHWSTQLGNTDEALSPQLRRGNRILNIQALLATEHFSVTPEQVMKLLEHKRRSALSHEVHRVLNVFVAYEDMPNWQPYNVSHLLAAHGCMMQGLLDDTGQWRQSDVGIYEDGLLMHRPPPPSQLERLMADLLERLNQLSVHPLIASCVFHYEFVFIHPFSDGNGRMGRLWQTLILSKWKRELTFFPIEAVIRQQQDEYYAALNMAVKVGDATGFVEYMLKALLSAMQEVAKAPSRDQVGAKAELISDQLQVLDNINGEMSLIELMGSLQRTNRTNFKSQILNPLIDARLIEPTIPNKPTSSKQKYRLKMECC
jgi:Fic family protein